MRVRSPSPTFISVIALALLSACGQQPQTDKLRALVESSRQFSTPYSENLPTDGAEAVATYEQWNGDVVASRQGKIPFGVDPWRYARRDLLGWLLSNKLAERVTLIWREPPYKDQDATHVVYKPELSQYVANGQLVVARRAFDEVTFANVYEGMGPQGTNTPLHSIVFKYRVVTKLPGWTTNDTPFEGKAIGFHDPSDGQFKLLSLKLGNEQKPELMPVALDPSVAKPARELVPPSPFPAVKSSGIWSGNAAKADGQTVSVSIDFSQPNYPFVAEGGCVGRLSPERRNGDAFEYTAYLRGDRCPGGIIRLTASGEDIGFERPARPYSNDGAVGTLKRDTQTPWAAIALSMRSGAWARSTQRRTQIEASMDALAECEKQNARDCGVALSVHGAACIAVAAKRQGTALAAWGSGNEPTIEAARTEAMTTCATYAQGGCEEILVEVCGGE